MSLLDRSVLGLRPETGETELDVLVEEIAGRLPLLPIAAQVQQNAEREPRFAHKPAQAISSDPAPRPSKPLTPLLTFPHPPRESTRTFEAISNDGDVPCPGDACPSRASRDDLHLR